MREKPRSKEDAIKRGLFQTREIVPNAAEIGPNGQPIMPKPTSKPGEGGEA